MDFSLRAPQGFRDWAAVYDMKNAFYGDEPAESEAGVEHWVAKSGARVVAFLSFSAPSPKVLRLVELLFDGSKEGLRACDALVRCFCRTADLGGSTIFASCRPGAARVLRSAVKRFDFQVHTVWIQRPPQEIEVAV